MFLADVSIFTNMGKYMEEYGLKILFVICIAIVGFIVVWFLGFLIKKLLMKTRIDGAIVNFFVSIFKILMGALIIIICASVLELSTSSLIVSLSTFALAVGLALKDSFSNLANGILIICNHPFKRGDHISVAGVEGKVQNINLLTVELITFDNVKIVLPNSTVLNSSLKNFSSLAIRRVELKYCVAYASDLDKVQNLLKEAFLNNPLTIKSMDITVFVSEYEASDIKFTVRAWVNNADYWTVMNGMVRTGYDTLMNNDVEIAFNQLDVHLDYKNKE